MIFSFLSTLGMFAGFIDFFSGVYVHSFQICLSKCALFRLSFEWFDAKCEWLSSAYKHDIIMRVYCTYRYWLQFDTSSSTRFECRRWISERVWHSRLWSVYYDCDILYWQWTVIWIRIIFIDSFIQHSKNDAHHSKKWNSMTRKKETLWHTNLIDWILIDNIFYKTL